MATNYKPGKKPIKNFWFFFKGATDDRNSIGSVIIAQVKHRLSIYLLKALASHRDSMYFQAKIIACKK